MRNRKKSSNKTVNEKNLLKTREQFQLLNELPMGYVVFNEKRILFINKRAAEVLKLNKADLQNTHRLNIYDFIFPEYQKRIKSNNKKILSGKEFPPIQLKAKTKKGKELFIEAKSKRITIDGEKFIQSVFHDISSRKITENLLLQRNQDLQLILDNIDEIVFYIDYTSKKKVRYISKQLETTLGLNEQEYEKLSSKMLKLCHPDDIPKIIDTAKELRRTGKPQKFIYRIKNSKTKQYVWLQERVFPQYDKNKKLIGNFGISRDVTNEARTEAELRKSELQFRQIADSANDIISSFVFFPEPHYTYISPSVKRILGYSQKDFYNDPLLGYKIIHPDDAHLTQKTVSAILSKKRPKGLETDTLILRYITKNKKTVWVETRSVLVRNTKNDIIGVESITRDITQQKESEQELIESRKTLSNLFTNLPGIAYRCKFDNNWTMLLLSAGCETLTEYKPDYFLNNNKKSFASIIHPDDQNLGKKEIEKAVKNKSSFEIEYRIISKSGKVKWVWEKGSGVYDGKKLMYLEGFITDITERKSIEQELNQGRSNYKSLVDAAPEGLFIHQNGKLVFVNPAGVKITEAANEIELYNINLFQFILPEYHAVAIERSKRAIQGETLEATDYKAKTLKGNIIDIRIRPTFLLYNGEPSVQLVVSDITKDKALEAERIRSRIFEETNKKLKLEIQNRVIVERELAEARNELKRIIDYSMDMIVSCDIKGNIVEFNRAACDTFEISREEAQTKNIRDLLVEEKDAEQIFNHMLASSLSYSGEILVKSKTGKLHYAWLSGSVIQNDEGKNIGVVAVLKDTTEKRRAEREALEMSEKLKSIFNSGSQYFWIVNKEHIFTFFNQNFAKAFYKEYGVYPEVNKGVSRIKNEWSDLWNQKYAQAFQGQLLDFVLERETENELMVRQNFLVPIKNPDGNVNEVACISNDITQLKEFEKISSSQAGKLSAIFESGRHLIWTVDRDFKLTSFNQQFAQTFYRNYNVFPELNKIPSLLVKANQRREYESFWHENYLRSFKGENLKLVKEELVEDSKLYREIFINPIYNETKDQVIEVSCFAHDITDTVLFRAKILEQTAKLSAIFESGAHMLWTVNKNIEVTSCNKNFEEAIRRMYGAKVEIGKRIQIPEGTIATQEYNENWVRKYLDCLEGKSMEFVSRRTNMDGAVVYRQVYLSPIRDNENNVVEIAGIGLDITTLKEAETNLKETIQEKEILLKEVHHRVKNNLQVISSILNLQSSFVKEESTLQILKECQNRIKSMAFIHETLYQTKNFSQINFSEYISTLSKNLILSYNVGDSKIKYRLDLEPMYLDLDSSIPCGLIVNELLSNALKYAFPGEREGFIFVILKKESNFVKLIIGDNGVGLPNGFDFRNTDSLGLQLVNTLVEQIDGKMEVNTEKGTQFNITFKA